MKGMFAAIAAAPVIAAMLFCAAPASADQDCQSAPVLGVNPPQVRTICDTPINPDGSWMRIREYWYAHGQSTQDATDLVDSKVYVVTPDTVPPGEPVHLG